MLALFFRVGAWRGWEAWRNHTPEKWQAKAAAKKLLKTHWNTLDPKDHKLVIDMPSQSYRLLDRRGRLATCERESVGI